MGSVRPVCRFRTACRAPRMRPSDTPCVPSAAYPCGAGVPTGPPALLRHATGRSHTAAGGGCSALHSEVMRSGEHRSARRRAAAPSFEPFRPPGRGAGAPGVCHGARGSVGPGALCGVGRVALCRTAGPYGVACGPRAGRAGLGGHRATPTGRQHPRAGPQFTYPPYVRPIPPTLRRAPGDGGRPPAGSVRGRAGTGQEAVGTAFSCSASICSFHTFLDACQPSSSWPRRQ